MLNSTEIPELLDCVDPATIRVSAPSSLLFLCGGKIDIRVDPAPSLRDAFARRQEKPPFERFKFLIAEELNGFFPRGNYKDILNFENDIAQISELIVLFSESYGSAAGLGAFAMVEEISHRMLVVIDNINHAEESFVTLGPLRMLYNAYGERAVCVLNLPSINLETIKNVSALKVDPFIEAMQAAIAERIRSYHERTTFNRSRSGHVIKFIVGLLQHYGALTFDEISLHLSVVDIWPSAEELDNYLLCGEFAEWILRDRRGLVTYFVAIVEKEALQYSFRADVPKRDRLRWRSDIRQFWRSEDKMRFDAIAAAQGGK